MRITTIVLLFTLSISLSSSANEGRDSRELKLLYDADQAIRSAESRAAGLVPKLQDERDRRFSVMRLLNEGEAKTANVFIHAGIILHHTSSYSGANGELISMGAESHLLAFFLFRQAHLRGHESGTPLMAAAYNYYLRACGEDPQRFGYRFENKEPVWRPEAAAEEFDEVKCGFDPRPYFGE